MHYFCTIKLIQVYVKLKKCSLMKKSILFPFWCQKIGWWTFSIYILWILALIIMRVCEVHTSTPPYWVGVSQIIIFYLMPTIAAILICLSQEKHEDEYIQHIRAYSVFIVIIIAFVAGLLSDSILSVLDRLTIYYTDEIGRYAQLAKNPAFLTIIYLLIFKGSLFINWLKTHNEDGQ